MSGLGCVCGETVMKTMQPGVEISETSKRIRGCFVFLVQATPCVTRHMKAH